MRRRRKVGRNHCPRCQEFMTCLCCLKPNENSKKGHGGVRYENADTFELTHYPIGMRLARGFAILSGNKHDI